MVVLFWVLGFVFAVVLFWVLGFVFVVWVLQCWGFLLSSCGLEIGSRVWCCSGVGFTVWLSFVCD